MSTNTECTNSKLTSLSTNTECTNSNLTYLSTNTECTNSNLTNFSTNTECTNSNLTYLSTNTECTNSNLTYLSTNTECTNSNLTSLSTNTECTNSNLTSLSTNTECTNSNLTSLSTNTELLCQKQNPSNFRTNYKQCQFIVLLSVISTNPAPVQIHQLTLCLSHKIVLYVHVLQNQRTVLNIFKPYICSQQQTILPLFVSINSIPANVFISITQ